MRLKIFSDQSYLVEGMEYEPIFHPFWGKVNNLDLMWSGIFDNYIKTSSSIFEMSALDSADLAIVPSNWEQILSLGMESLFIQFVEKVKQVEKPILSFFGGDCSHLNLPVESNLVLRNSLYRSTKKSNDFAIPAWSEDYVSKYLSNQIIIRQKRLQPTVGFCGFVSEKNFVTYLKLFYYKSKKILLNQKGWIPPYSIGHVLRSLALSFLSNSSLIETNFIKRERSFFFNKQNLNLQKNMSLEFVQNMIESDYVFCCRGSGNYSFRFYEALCCGRIPVFIDTDCVLPYDFEVDYKNYCVWIDESEISLIAEKIAEFHENISPQEFVDLQHECRRFWQQRISPEGFFANFYRHLLIT